MRGAEELDTLSLDFDGLERVLKKSMKIDQRVDAAALLRAFKNRVEKLAVEQDEIIKADLLDDNKSIVEGDRWMGQINPVRVFRLDIEKTKKFLGKRLRNFGGTRTENRLVYKPRG